MTSAHSGLTTSEALRRLKQYGENIAHQKQKTRPVVAFIKKFNSPLLVILIAAGVISFFVGESTNAIILLLMIFVSAIVDFVTTYRSEKAVEKLVSNVLTTATTIRDGAEGEVPLKYLVPGDVVLLSAGDVIPADCQMVEADDFFVDESTLTGESFPVEKIPGKEFLFMGTHVVSGFGKAVVVKTGAATEFGKIVQTLSNSQEDSDFEKNIKSFSVFIMKVTFVMVVGVFGANALIGRPILESFIFSIAIAVGLTPELLPVILVVSLSRGSIQMGKKNVIVKNLHAIESFGSMNILCTDKTGTLTQNNIVLVDYLDGFGKTSSETLRCAFVSSVFHTGVANPLDTAIVNFKKLQLPEVKKIDEIPFDFYRKRASMVVVDNGKRLMVTKGAPEQVIAACSSYISHGTSRVIDSKTKLLFIKQFQALSADGMRVLGVAKKSVPGGKTVYKKEEEQHMTFIGFVTFVDPPKPGARQAIDELEALGVEMKILTGDSPELTGKICRDIDIAVKGLLTGEEIGRLTDAELAVKLRSITIAARMSPEQKERVIKILKHEGNVVGYLGDGANDAPALKAADIGISVNNAVDVARETADFILTHKSLNVLKDGVVEGRKIYANTMKYIMMGMSSNFGNMVSMMVASVFLPFLPMLPKQILFNNFLYDSSQLSLSADHVDHLDVATPPKWRIGFIKSYMVVFGIVSSLFDILTFSVLLFSFHLSSSQFQTGWFLESITTQVLVIYIIRTRKIPFLQSMPSLPVILNTLLIVGIAWIVPYTPMSMYFSFRLLPVNVLITIVSIAVVYLCATELVKKIYFSRVFASR